jgi:2-polyprenyl-6-methoxyphenol hydroxylase-like FAD-dependent oxidoreductase
MEMGFDTWKKRYMADTDSLMANDFLIIGGGIGGAVLANLLGRRGKRVLVLEKGRATLPQNRPEILWPATVEVLRTLIPKSLEQCWMVPIRGGVLTYRGRRLLQFGPDVFDSAGVQPYSTANTRELLLQQAPCEYQRGVEVTQLLREQGKVVGVRTRDTASGTEREILADWTVGDDGAHSLIRRSCGLPMNFVRLPVELLGFSFDWPQRLPVGTVHIWLNEDRLQTGVLGMPMAPLPEGRGTALIPIWREAFQNHRRLQRALHAFSSQDPLLNELIGWRTYPRDFTHFRLAWGRTPRFGVPGAVLLGDAAHPVTPAGGQGANASIADALVIAEAALERSNELLTEYERRRRAPTLRSLSLSRGVNRIFSLPRPLINLGLMLLPWAVGALNNRPATFGRFLRIAAEAFRERPAGLRADATTIFW